MSTAYLLWSLLFGSIGVGYFVYGKRQQKFSALASGAALCIYTFFVTNTFLMVAIGVGLLALPFVTDY